MKKLTPLVLVFLLLTACNKTTPPELEITSGDLTISETESTATTAQTTAVETAAPKTEPTETEPQPTAAVSEETAEPQTNSELTEEELEILSQMPEIVFVNFNIGINNIFGHVIGRNGIIRYFNFQNDEILIFDSYSFFSMPSTVVMEEYVSYRNLGEFHKMIQENSSETDIKPILETDLIVYYKTLLQIKRPDTKLKRNWTNMGEENLCGIYGVILNENNEEILFLIGEYGPRYFENEDSLKGDKFYLNKESLVFKFYEELMGIFPYGNINY